MHNFGSSGRIPVVKNRKSFWNPNFNFTGLNQAFKLLEEETISLEKESRSSLNDDMQGLIYKLVALACVLGRKAKENSWVKERKIKQC